MIIAIFGDIHGNIEALRAAYRAVESSAEKIFHLGDIGGYAPFVNEVADFLIEHGIAGVQGNYDDAVANDREHCGCKYEDPVQAEMTALSFEWTKKRATQKTKEYLKHLPKERSFFAQDRKILLFHAAPHKNNLYWYEDRPEKFFMEMAGKTDADILIYGHTHKPYRKDLGERVFINAGSVGKPKDGDPRACVTLLDITPDMVRTEFLRIEYDVEKTAAAIVEQGLPPYFAEKLRQGR
jgi:putative phosphoesterase